MGISRQQKQIHKVMIVEDELDILLLYKDFLRSKGYSVIVSSTFADEILTDYEKYMPDLVIIDYKLPGKKNGLQATREILGKYSLTPILLVTAFENVKEELSKDEFFSDKKIQILIKPVKLARLAQTIQNINNEQNLKSTTF
ncbi:MAG TPA: response regulator [Nitrososphaeraceae archaeon]|jgi:DNA-binding response OmpR family regulator